LRQDAAIFRNPRQQQEHSAQNFTFFIYLGRLMKLTAALFSNKERHSIGVGGKKLSNILADTMAHISWFLSPSLYGTAVYDGLEILCASALNTKLRLRVRNKRIITPPPLLEVLGRRQSRPKGMSSLIPFSS
jgi:hypothetical protein